ncbi:MAG: glycogen/starch synthase, partial [Anaerolineae bacterium]
MFSWEYPPHVNGGMGNHVTSLIPALADQGVDVHLVTLRLNGGEPVERVKRGVTVHRVEPASWESGDIVTDAHEANNRMTNHAEAVVGEYGPFDLVHAHDWLVALSAFHFKHEYRW